MDEPLVIAAHPDRRQRPGRYDALIGGLHLAPALITHDGNQSGVQIAVHPLGCRALFGLPAGELAGLDTDFGAVAGDGFVGTLRDRLRDAGTWPERFALLDDTMARLIRERAAVHPDVAYAFDRLVDSGGEVTVGELAGEIGWSARHLTNRFRAEVGLRPKETARVVRFDRARRLLHAGRPARRRGGQGRLFRPGPSEPGVPRPGRPVADPVAGGRDRFCPSRPRGAAPG